MTNFRAAFITFLALMDNGYDQETAQEIASKRFDLDECEAEGLIEELETSDPETLASYKGGDPKAYPEDFDLGDVYVPNDEPEGSYDLSDDAEALASVGWGTDEDYGHYGGDEY